MQFVITGEQGILQHAIVQLKKVPLKEQRGPQERLHLKSLLSRNETDNKLELTFLQSFLLPIQRWADKLLGDYHLHFPEVHKLIMFGIYVMFCFKSKSFHPYMLLGFSKDGKYGSCCDGFSEASS